MDAALKKKIEELVKEMNSMYVNKSDPKIVRTVDVGRVRLHLLSFIGQDNYHHTNYVTEFKGDLRPFNRIEHTIPEINKGFGIVSLIVERSRMIVIGLLALLLVSVISYLAITGEEINGTLNNLAVLLIGYLAGKGESKLANSDA